MLLHLLSLLSLSLSLTLSLSLPFSLLLPFLPPSPLFSPSFSPLLSLPPSPPLSLKIISMAPDHRIWKRQRGVHHGGAIRAYMKHGTPQYGRSSPAYCRYCMRVEFQQYLMEGKLGGADELLTDSVSTFWPSQIQFDLLDAIDLKHEECHHPSSKCTIHLSILSYIH